MTEPREYQGEDVRGLVERLAPAFQEHLRDEIDSLLLMQRYAWDAGKGEGLMEVYKAAEAEAEAGKQDKVC
jgi:hypothetical protein